uniref:Small ribosomal subunit protein uS2c n=1 Tax=Codium simulans TaxID=589376 RepID=A0A1I9LKK3_9CHLO|nr:30S ribosomal protein S2 [Codium simulans]ANJ70864.1 30S ribosomal protein S2 [Codium simulans]
MQTHTILNQMIKAGLHFGHTKDQWNPKMAPYIYKQKNGVHIIDIIQTWFYIRQVSKFLEISTAKGHKVLFVGTKKQAAQLIQFTALRCNSFFVNQRWLGGCLTNWKTIQKSIRNLNILSTKSTHISSKHTFLKKKKKKQEKLLKYFKGLRNMKNVPEIVIIIGQQKELNAVYECQKLGLRTITILDTNCNPLLADLFIPANDDSISSIKFILDQLAVAILKGKQSFKLKQTQTKKQKEKSNKIKSLL